MWINDIDMQIWKFLLKGITGDLAKLKILPALAQFAHLNQDKVQVDLIGYSRSKPEPKIVESILNRNSPDNKHKLRSINCIQGQYDDPTTFFNLIGGLGENERLVTYLAIPPHQFINILKNACPFSTREIDIIIEKPFGRNLQEAEDIMSIINACDLNKKVYFCDHYLFKTASHISKTDMNNFKALKDKDIEKIEVKALEKVDVKDRLAYYDSIGALKDIFIHLFSILDMTLDLKSQCDFEAYSNFEVLDVELGQYEDYLTQGEELTKNTNTYFKVLGRLEINNKNVEILLESGKKLHSKITETKIQFGDGWNLIWNIEPHKHLNLESQNIENNYSLNLDRNNKNDHTNLFEDLMRFDRSRFVSDHNIHASWAMYDKITEFIKNNNIKPRRYKNYLYPVEFIT